MTKFLLPIAINVINKAVDKIPEDLDDLLKKFVITLLKKAANSLSEIKIKEFNEIKKSKIAKNKYEMNYFDMWTK